MNNNKEGASREQLPWIILCILLTLGIVAVFCFALIPKYFGEKPSDNKTKEGINFSDSQWLDGYMQDAAGLIGKDFIQDAALSCGQGSARILMTYASEQSVDELRDAYMKDLNAEEKGRNDETALNLTVELPQGKLTVSNVFSQICRLIKLDLQLSEEEQQHLEQELTSSFPEDWLKGVPELEALLSRERHGFYVRYIYDTFDPYLRGDEPVFSCAYPGSEDEWETICTELKQRFDNSIESPDDPTWYFESEGNLLGLTFISRESGDDLISVFCQLTP